MIKIYLVKGDVKMNFFFIRKENDLDDDCGSLKGLANVILFYLYIIILVGGGFKLWKYLS